MLERLRIGWRHLIGGNPLEAKNSVGHAGRFSFAAACAGLLVLTSLLAMPAFAVAKGGAAPSRMVSTNVCTDQYAMLIAGEGQLLSVSHLASDPHASVMVEAAKAYKTNHGRAEEIFLMQPDLVLAGTYTARATVELMRRLGFRVELFEPVKDFSDVREQMVRIGKLLGREERAAELVAQLDAGLAAADGVASGKTAVAWSANSYAAGAGTFTDATMQAAGLTNPLAEQGIRGGGRVPLEVLLTVKPDLVITSATPYDAPARAQGNLRHQAFHDAFGGERQIGIPDAYWTCGTPFTLEAIRILRDAAGAAQ